MRILLWTIAALFLGFVIWYVFIRTPYEISKIPEPYGPPAGQEEDHEPPGPTLEGKDLKG